jgi:phosphate transport system permease protein
MNRAINTIGHTGPMVRWRKIKNSAWLIVTGFCALALLAPLCGISVYLVVKGAGALDWNFFTSIPKPVGEMGGGVANALVGSIIVVGLAAVAAIPVGIGIAVFINEFGRGSAPASAFRFVCDMFNATPSIVIGIFAYSVVVLWMGRFSAIAGSFALFVMMVPVIVRGTEEILKTVPNALREASLALGASQSQTVWNVVLPAALRGITTAVFLSVARVGGETAPLLFTALGNDFMTLKVAQPINTLPVQIYKFASSPYQDWHRQAWAAALVLVFAISLVNAGARWLARPRTV